MLSALWEFITSRPVKWLAGAIIAMLGVYGTFFYERKPDVVFEIISNSSVLDVREPLSKLAITYDGADLKAQNKTLYLISIRIANRGNADIVKTSFDEADPLGFTVNDGVILETPVIVADDYLMRNLQPNVHNGHTTTFSPVILNSGDSFEIRTLVLVPTGKIPSISTIGKIAAVRQFKIAEPYKDSINRNVFQEAFGGRVAIQLVRTAGYLVAAFLLFASAIVVFVLPGALLAEQWQKRGRKQRAAQFRTAIARRLSLKQEYLLDKYIADSPYFHIFRAIARGEALTSDIPVPVQVAHADQLDHIRDMAIHAGNIPESAYEELESVGLIVRDGPQISIFPDFEAAAKELLSFLAEPSDKQKKS